MKLTIFIVRHLIPIATYAFLWVRYGWTWETLALVGVVIFNVMAASMDTRLKMELKP
jgi:hypothetical protein